MLTAFAETAAATAAPVAEAASTGSGLNAGTIVSLCLTGYFILIGLASLFTGKVYGMGKSTTDRYTDESLAKAARPWGLVMLTLGLGLLCFDLTRVLTLDKTPNLVMLIGGIVLDVLAVVIYFFSCRKQLVKKDQK